MADRWEQKLPCQDAHGRPRDLTIFVSADHKVGIFTPPGDTAKLSPGQVTELQQALAAAMVKATRRGAEQ
jgi:hypothetical protein